MNNSKTFENVTDLSLFIEVLDDKSDYYFQNIKSLTLMTELGSFQKLDYNVQLEKRRPESLQMIVNLSNLKYLHINHICNIASSTMLLEILKHAPQLSSLVIYKSTLISFLINDELCQYLNKMINILDITDYCNNKYIEPDESNKLCQIFSNIEQLQCCINATDIFLFILNHLPKLKVLKIIFSNAFSSDIIAWLKITASKLNIHCINI